MYGQVDSLSTNMVPKLSFVLVFGWGVTVGAFILKRLKFPAGWDGHGWIGLFAEIACNLAIRIVNMHFKVSVILFF